MFVFLLLEYGSVKREETVLYSNADFEIVNIIVKAKT